MRKVVALLSIGVLAFAFVTMKMYSDSVDRVPWKWSGEDWGNYLTFSRETAKDATETMRDKAKQAHEKFQAVDWDAVKTKITDKTKALWNNLTKMEEKIESRLKVEKDKRELAAREEAKIEKVAAEEKIKEFEAKKSAYEEALEAMRDASKSYRNSPNSNKAIKDAKHRFENARELFEKALKDVPEDQRSEVESMIQQCNQYIYDCVKREKV